MGLSGESSRRVTTSLAYCPVFLEQAMVPGFAVVSSKQEILIDIFCIK